ncbi:transmembrane protein 176A-like [Leptodactylus fuscus]|uniref:transmembrane protein 176A-like n=1 Tax=Leptodactylus fuscus TaxID=238119 RepID=UPI003F4F1658
MSVSTVKTENGNVSCETPEGTVVHININQRSALDCLLDTFRLCQEMKKNRQTTEPCQKSGSAAHLGYGAAFITLGFASLILAVIICIVRPNLIISYTGLHFWVGTPFLVSGALNLVAYKFPKRCWTGLAFISLLANFSVSIAGIVLTSNDIDRSYWIYDEQVCDRVRNGDNYGYDYGNYYRTAKPSRYGYENDYYMQRCKDAMRDYKILMVGLTIMTLLMVVWGLLLSIFSLYSRLKQCCSSCRLAKPEEESDLLKPSLSDDLITV